MKKIFTICSAIAICIAAQAQVNLGIKFANYTNGQTFSNDTIRTEFIITNHGSTMYHTGDTLFVNARINGSLRSLNLFGTNATPIVLAGMLHVGDSMHYNPGIIYASQTLPFFPGATTLEVCMIVWGKGIASVSPLYGGDLDATNNTACITHDPSFTSGIKSVSSTEIGLSVFPNPTSEYVQFDFKNPTEVAAMSIIDITGRKIEDFITPKQNTTLNVSNWNKGIYFYHVQMNNGKIATGKIIVN